MKAKTNTNCKECMHRKVCHKLYRPDEMVKALESFYEVDDNGIDTVVSCQDFHKEYPVDKIVYREPLFSKPMREDMK